MQCFYVNNLVGEISAAIVQRALYENPAALSDAHQELKGYIPDYERLGTDLEFIAVDEGDGVIYSKMCFNNYCVLLGIPIIVQQMGHIKYKTNRWNIHWFDSFSDEGGLQRIAGYAYSDLHCLPGLRACSAPGGLPMLVWTYFYPNQPVPDVVKLMSFYDLYRSSVAKDQKNILWLISTMRNEYLTREHPNVSTLAFWQGIMNMTIPG